MTISKNTKMLLGVAVLGTGAYLYWKSTQPKGAKASFMSTKGSGYSPQVGCPCRVLTGKTTKFGDITLSECAGGQWCNQDDKNPKPY